MGAQRLVKSIDAKAARSSKGLPAFDALPLTGINPRRQPFDFEAANSADVAHAA
jgi:hypothetical protein